LNNTPAFNLGNKQTYILEQKNQYFLKCGGNT